MAQPASLHVNFLTLPGKESGLAFCKQAPTEDVLWIESKNFGGKCWWAQAKTVPGMELTASLLSWA